MAITSSATAPTAPPTIALIFKLPLPEGDVMSGFEAEVVEVGKPVAGGVWVVLPVGTGEDVPEAPINSPGPISGLSEERRCEDDREENNGEKNSYSRRTSIYSHSIYSPAGI